MLNVDVLMRHLRLKNMVVAVLLAHDSKREKVEVCLIQTPSAGITLFPLGFLPQNPDFSGVLLAASLLLATDHCCPVLNIH